MTSIATKYPFVGSIDTKQGGRLENQDNAGFVDTPLGLLLVVCDGMGGGPGGRTASLIAVDTILNVLSDVSEHTPREDALRFAIEKANDLIYAKARDIQELRGMGTTVAAILINEDSAIIAHAGDTRIYQLRKGTIVFRSSDHSVVANLVRQKKITEEEARNHPQSNIVTRALGIRPNMEIEFDEVTFLRGDRFVVCTDGIWGMLPQRDLIKSLSLAMGIDELIRSITEEIDKIGQENGGGHDNLTLAVFDTSFDSNLRRIKKKPNTDISVASIENGEKPSEKKKIILLLITLVILSAVILFVYLSQNSLDSGKAQEQKVIKGSTVSTLEKRTLRVIEEDSTVQEQTTIVNPVTSLTNREIDNPFRDTTIRDEQNKEIVRQINNAVQSLENLKIIKGKNKGNAEERKRKYVQGVIRPVVNRLEDKVITEKKKDVKKILEMLNNKKTISCNSRGQTTDASKKHIEEIKTKIQELRN